MHKTSGGYWLWVALLAGVMAIGAYAGLQIFLHGLSVTGLNDSAPWGLWITLDLAAIGLSAGAFTLSAAVYLLGLTRLESVARIAVFIGMIGYSMALLCFILDIGRPERFWHGWVFWNPHSILWEVTMCITLYSSILLLEVLTIVAEHDRLKPYPVVHKIAGRLHSLLPVLAVIGMLLSLLHQSSLGATFGVIKARPIWYKPNMPILFMVSAVTAGSAFTILVISVLSRLNKRPVVKWSLVEDVARFVGMALLALLYLKFWDTLTTSYSYLPLRSEMLAETLQGSQALVFWGGEIILGGVLPAVMMLTPIFRKSINAMLFASSLVVAGLITNRWEVTMTGVLTPLSLAPVMPVATTGHYGPT